MGLAPAARYPMNTTETDAGCGGSDGARAGPPAPAPATGPRELVRPADGRVLGGVCAAFARRFGVDVTWIRVGAVLLAFTWGAGFLAYVVCWFVIPKE